MGAAAGWSVWRERDADGNWSIICFFNQSTFSSACPGIWADAATRRWPAAQLMDTCAAGWERQMLRGDTFQTAPQPSVSSALCRLFWLESFFFIKPNTSLKSDESALLVRCWWTQRFCRSSRSIRTAGVKCQTRLLLLKRQFSPI